MKARVGTSFEELDPAFVQCILPLVDVVEVTPDALAVAWDGQPPAIPAATLEALAQIAEQATIAVHGIGLSIGSWHGWNDNYFRLLDQILEAVPVAWHSEHLGFTHVNGQFLGTMLCLPRTEEALDLVAQRAQAILQRYPLPFLLEHTVNLLPDPPASMSAAGFLNRLAGCSGCELLLDVYNLECDAHNQGFQVSHFLDELNLALVREIHLAGGVERDGLKLDIHSRASAASTRELLRQVIPRCPQLQAVVYEIMPQAIPALGHHAWADELLALHSVCADDEA